jgi:hypothetical protein
LASRQNDRDEGADSADQVHEFTLLRFAPGIEASRQQLVMEALGHHLSRCEGLVAREIFGGGDGDWIEHVVWASQADLDGAEGIEDDPVLACLFDCFDTHSVSYLRGGRVEPEGLGTLHGSDPAVPL